MLTLLLAALVAAPAGIAWQDWSPAAFDAARRDHRLVLLDVGAVWCHWCHVMDETTYEDARVVRLVGDRFVAVRVDQDARPDLSNRYEDYGWPATVVLDAEGRELVKLQGYIEPDRMTSMLQAVADDPTPGPSVTGETAAPVVRGGLREHLLDLLAARYDDAHGGWGFTHKYLDADSVEHEMARAAAGDRTAERRARETLAAERKLIDPVWGGAFQYSDSGDWDHPHFERIMSRQADDLRGYARAWATWHDPADRRAAEDVRRYLDTFLRSPEGAFYVSQDADLVQGEHAAAYYAKDDASRRALGVPRVDRHLYARENAWAASGLAAWAMASGEGEPLAQALAAARWVVAERAVPGGGFRHDARDAGGPYLGDTVAAAAAFLDLYTATADRQWLQRSVDAVRFADRTFRIAGHAGFATAVTRSALEPPTFQREENVVLARTANLLSRHTGDASLRAIAEHAMAWARDPEVASRFNPGGVLLAWSEVESEPLHVTVVGRRDDPAAQALLQEARAVPVSYKRVELLDRREGPLPAADVQFPELSRAAAFLCTGGRCSRPAYTAEDLRARLAGTAAPTTADRR